MELFDLVNDHGDIIGIAPRQCCHGNPALQHRTAHVIVRSSDGRILLQKRALTKDVKPGCWDTAVGGHLAHGEDYLTAAKREMTEEIGIPAPDDLRPLFPMRITNSFESEQTLVFTCTSDGPFTPQPGEVDELRFWTIPELHAAIGTGVLTPYLEHELSIFFNNKTTLCPHTQP